MTYSVKKTEAEWRDQLNAFEYQVLRLAATERPYTGELLNEERQGSFHCRGCDAQLFESGTKFDSHCGWPSFYESKPESIEYIEDRSHGMVRTEVRCAACGSHLGHLFDDAPQTPTGMRYCINSVSMTFKPKA
jgi:peptide-methionine (R)-S-oxide reductase